jgi:hypothetical protein
MRILAPRSSGETGIVLLPGLVVKRPDVYVPATAKVVFIITHTHNESASADCLLFALAIVPQYSETIPVGRG